MFIKTCIYYIFRYNAIVLEYNDIYIIINMSKSNYIVNIKSIIFNSIDFKK